MTNPIGRTVGVEEEYHLVDPESLALVNRPDLSARALANEAGGHVHAEMLTSQLEAVTGVCTSLEEVRTELVTVRREAAEAAAGQGAALLATSTHPFARLEDIRLMVRERYDRLLERFGTIPRQLNLTGCHVHVGVPDLDTAVRVMTAARPYLPVLAALTGSSPFHEGVDTHYASFRLAWLDLWPQGGPPPPLRSGAHYVNTVAQLVAVGLIDDASNLLWELRPSSRYPTLEFRIADMCTDLDDAVLLTAMVRSLVRTLATRATAVDVSDAVLRAARWRASRFGLGNTLWSPTRSVLQPAAAVVGELLDELRPDLVDHDEFDTVTDLLAQLRSRGTSAMQQRRAFAEHGDLRGVARQAAAVTARCL